MFSLPKDTEITLDLLATLIDKHKNMVSGRYEPLLDLYTSEHEILNQPKKPDYKPDNRIVVNFAKYMVDTMNGFFLGNDIKITSDNKETEQYVSYLNRYSDQDNNNSELSKICSIYGKGYEMYYTDESSELCITYLDPREAFMVFDESILERPLYFIRYYKDHEGVEHGSISDKNNVRYFKNTGGYDWESEWEPHYFDGVPATRYVENEEKQGIFEPVISLINAYDKAISEKANDVDYFADAYLKILGADVNKDDINFIRNNRVINFSGDGVENITADFMDKPNSDTTQENLLDRMERLIYQIGMIANISDENFGTSSGIAMKYKLQAMSNLEKTKERKFKIGMNRRYKLLFSHPLSKVSADEYVNLNYYFTPNIPANLLEESQIAGNLTGITSQETQLKIISAVDDVQQEIERMEQENDKTGYHTNFPTDRVVSDTQSPETQMQSGSTEIQGKQLNGAQTQSLIAIMAQFTAGSLTEGQATNLISTAIGVSKEEAKAILNGVL